MNRKNFLKLCKDNLFRPFVKVFISGILTTSIAVLPPLLGIGGEGTPAWKIALLVITSIVYIAFLVISAKNDTNSRRATVEREKQMQAYKAFSINTITICQQSATGVTKCIHDMLSNGKVNLSLWSFDMACFETCRLIYGAISQLRNDENFEVTYIKLVESNTQQCEIVMNSYANKNSQPPTIFGKSRIVNPIESPGDYHDMDFFRHNKSGIDVKMDPDEVDSAFGYASKQHRELNKKKYNSYIGIPIFCNHEKLVGLLQVVALEQAKFGITKQEAEEMANKFLIPYSYMFLLLHKLEKALISVPKSQKSV